MYSVNLLDLKMCNCFVVTLVWLRISILHFYIIKRIIESALRQSKYAPGSKLQQNLAKTETCSTVMNSESGSYSIKSYDLVAVAFGKAQPRALLNENTKERKQKERCDKAVGESVSMSLESVQHPQHQRGTGSLDSHTGGYALPVIRRSWRGRFKSGLSL